MNVFFLIMLLIGISTTHLSSQSEFITTWETLNVNESITLEAPSRHAYNYDVDWGDGSSKTGVNRTITHTYASPGIYKIEINGTFPHFSVPDASRLISIDQWGTQVWRSMRGAFSGAANMTYNAPDIPNLSAVTDMSSMFKACNIFNGDIGDWDVSNVEDLSNMFENAWAFDQNLGNWDISNVTSTSDMFIANNMSIRNYDLTIIGWSHLSNPPSDLVFRALGAHYCASKEERDTLIQVYNWQIFDDTKDCSFITTWNTELAGSSDSMSITIPTHPDSNYNYSVDWNNDHIYEQSGITGDITHTFPSPGIYTIRIKGEFPMIYFNQISPNSSGDAKKIINIDQWGENVWGSMNSSFAGCSNLNSDAMDHPDLRNVTDLSSMFRGATIFNHDIGNWSTENVRLMWRMFEEAQNFNQNIGSWNTSNVVDMFDMFSGAQNFNQNIGNWNTQNVTDMSGMFAGAINFNQDISNWNVSSVENLHAMFVNALSFNQDIGNWSTESVNRMDDLFQMALSFNQDISNWNTSRVTDMSDMFFGAANFDQNLDNWDISNMEDMEAMFDDSGMSRLNYDFTLYGWSQQANLPSGLDLGAGSLLYCAGQESRQMLIDDYDWNITGDNYECPSNCSAMFFNSLVSPTEDWDSSSSWDHDNIATACDIVIIPDGHTVVIPSGFPAICYALNILIGGQLIIEDGGSIEVVND